jgi:triacylglycerol lipase
MTRPWFRLTLATVLLLLTVSMAYASDVGQRTSMRVSTNSHTHFGTSPFAPPDADDTLFVVDRGPGLDTGCTFRRGSPLQIKIPIKRAVGAVDGFGYLADPAGLKLRGLISPTAKLIIPAFDIDVAGPPYPEVDRVEFNGHNLGNLTGSNGIWKGNEFRIPIEWIRFPHPAMGGLAYDEPTGAEPIPADNTVMIHIDEANTTGNDGWCMAVDWVQLEFKAIAPIFLVHGIAAQSDTWDTSFKTYFDSARVPYSSKINLIENGSVEDNARELDVRLYPLVRAFGARKFHIVAHSKGGLDTRLYTNTLYNPKVAKLLSVSTLSTPHHGSVAADIIHAARRTNDPDSTDPDIERLIDFEQVSPPQEPGLLDLKTDSAANFNRYQPLRTDIQWWGWGANADANGNGTIDVPSETDVMIPDWIPNNVVSMVMNSTYRVLANVETITITTVTDTWGLNEYTAIEKGQTYGFPVGNDLAVTTLSAFPPRGGSFMGAFQANHTTIRSSQAAQSILIQIMNQFPNN